MADISLETVAGKLNRVGYDAFLQSLRHAKNEGNRNVELSHWLFHIVQNPKSDISATLNHFKLDRAKLERDLAAVIDSFRSFASSPRTPKPLCSATVGAGCLNSTPSIGSRRKRSRVGAKPSAS